VNVYFELADCAAKDVGGKYFALYNTPKSTAIMNHTRYLMLCSERVWAEEEDSVRFLKHRRQAAESTPVDEREFVWIRLQCRTV
jgi:hypothetical protein